eukprot:scaffold12412_cov75-Phaeocystis_antarctica.AAC.2
MRTLVRSSCGSSSGDESRAARRASWSYIDRRRHMPSPEPRASTPPTSSASLACCASSYPAPSSTVIIASETVDTRNGVGDRHRVRQRAHRLSAR